MPRAYRVSFPRLALFAVLAGLSSYVTAGAASTSILCIPGGSQGLDFDDLGYSRALDRILMPAAQTGALICFVILLLFWGLLLVSVLFATGNLVWYYLALHAGATSFTNSSAIAY